MSDTVLVPMEEGNVDALLKAAGDDPSQVEVVSGHSNGLTFQVPKALAKKAGVDTLDDEPDLDDQVKADAERLAGYEETANGQADLPEQEPEKPAAKKAAKRPAKKAAKKTAKKSTAKKTAKKS